MKTVSIFLVAGIWSLSGCSHGAAPQATDFQRKIECQRIGEQQRKKIEESENTSLRYAFYSKSYDTCVGAIVWFDPKLNETSADFVDLLSQKSLAYKSWDLKKAPLSQGPPYVDEWVDSEMKRLER